MAVEHSQDKRQLAAWVDRKLAETVDEVASKRGITRTAAITEALQRYVEEETSVALQLSDFAEKLETLLERSESMQNELEEIKQMKPARSTRKAKTAAGTSRANALSVLETGSPYEHFRNGRYPCLIRHRKTLRKLLRHYGTEQRRLRDRVRRLRACVEQLGKRAILAPLA